VFPDLNQTLDRGALADRLFADAVAAPVRDPALFRRADHWASRAETEHYVDSRSAVHRDDLGGTEADAEWARTEALRLWRMSFHRHRHSDRVIYTLSAVAARLLCAVGHDVTLRVDKEPGREILRWRFISLALPPSTTRPISSPRAAIGTIKSSRCICNSVRCRPRKSAKRLLQSFAT